MAVALRVRTDENEWLDGCGMLWHAEVRDANAEQNTFRDRFAALEIQLVMKQEQLIQFHEFLKKQESCHRILFLLQGAGHRHKRTAIDRKSNRLNSST